MQQPIDLELPAGKVRAELVTLATYKAESGVDPRHLRALGFLHKAKAHVWRHRLTEQERREYEEQLPSLAEAFADALPEGPYAALVVAPSSRPDLVCPFALAVRRRFPHAHDLSPFFSREATVRSGEGASFDELLEATRCDTQPWPTAVGTLLVLDDVYSKGTTAAVLAHLLRERYGDLPIVVGCPLRTISESATFKAPNPEELRLLMATTEIQESSDEGAEEPGHEEGTSSNKSETSIGDEMKPKVWFSGADLRSIEHDAHRRREEAITYLCQNSRNPPRYTGKEVRAQNTPGNHYVGEATERALLLWLTKKGVRHSRAASVVEELRDGVPDIMTSPHGVRLDAKGSILFSNGRLCCRQVKDAPSLAVVWCLPLRPFGYEHDRDYDTSVPLGVKILGWSTMAEVGAVERVEGWHEVPAGDMREPSTLLEWIATGACPVRAPLHVTSRNKCGGPPIGT
jgi:hypothetical protein